MAILSALFRYGISEVQWHYSIISFLILDTKVILTKKPFVLTRGVMDWHLRVSGTIVYRLLEQLIPSKSMIKSRSEDSKFFCVANLQTTIEGTCHSWL